MLGSNPLPPGFRDLLLCHPCFILEKFEEPEPEFLIQEVEEVRKPNVQPVYNGKVNMFLLSEYYRF